MNCQHVLTLNWQTLERRRIIKQAMTFYKILNNINKISPPTGLLTRSHSRHHYIVPRSRLNTVVGTHFTLEPSASGTQFQKRSLKLHNRIISSNHKQTPFHHPNSSKMLVTKPHSGIIVLMLSRLLPVSWQCHTVVSDHTVSNHQQHQIIHLSYISTYKQVGPYQ